MRGNYKSFKGVNLTVLENALDYHGGEGGWGGDGAGGAAQSVRGN